MGKAEAAHEDLALTRLRAYWDGIGLRPEERVYAEFQARRYPHVLEFWMDRPEFRFDRALDLGGGVGGVAVVLHAALGGEFDLAEYVRLPADRLSVARQFGIHEAYRADLTDEDPLREIPGRYPAILLVEVLEHLLVNPRALVRSLRSHLDPGGLLFVTTPNVARLTNRVRLLRGRSIRERNSFPEAARGPFGHVAEFTLGDLTELFGLEGYTQIAGTIVQNPPTPPGLAVRTHSRGALRRLGAWALDRPAVRPLGLGDEIQALFRRD
ncbi:MAG: methyltransferase domain-containing protein [Thermoplasmata archaeon]